MNEFSAKDLSGKKVIITGMSGFTGRILADKLRSCGVEVFGISSVIKQDSKNSYAISLNNYPLLLKTIEAIQPDYVIHLAAISYTAHKNSTPYYETNVVGTENLLKACLSISDTLEKVILASSAAVYGLPNADEISENHELKPISHYGCSKLSMELIADTYRKTLPILTVRPFNYTGPGQKESFLIPKIIRHFKDKRASIELGNTNVIREFGDIRDITDCYLHLLSVKNLSTLNICSGEAIALEDVISTLERITDHKIDIIVNPDFIRENDIQRLVGDNTNLQNEIKRPFRYSLKQTLEDMLAFA